MVYKVIGLMSGSSLDGLDIAYVQLEEVRGKWDFSILQTACVPYDDVWTDKLKTAIDLSTSGFLKLHTAYGRYMGQAVANFMSEHDLAHKVHFIASHGHTVFHEPSSATTFQLGEGATIAAIVGLPVISDLRAMDVALGGQGAPIVPVGDRGLFGGYNYLLNIGGIANITVQTPESSVAFDICPANQGLNALARRAGVPMDKDGAMARSGRLLPEVMAALSAAGYYQQEAPKSLSNDAAMAIASAAVDNTGAINDLLHTFTHHIAEMITNAVVSHATGGDGGTLLVTGGGAHNSFLIEELRGMLSLLNIDVTVPDSGIVDYKEAIVMAYIGALRWREEANVFASVTGAARDSIGGALWLP